MILLRQPPHSLPVPRRAFNRLRSSTPSKPVNPPSPAFSLPPEILAVIIEAAQQNDPTTRGSAVSQRVEIIVSHVCKHWRELAINSPLLWTKIESASRGLREAYLSRSKGVSIDVVLNLQWWSSRTVSDHAFIASLLRSSTRWRTLSISGNLDYMTLQMFHDLHTPVLKSVTIDVPSCSGLDMLKYPEILGGGAPLLDTLRVSGTGLAFCRPPLGSLNTLILDTRYPQSYTQFLAVVTSSPTLASLTCRGQVWTDWPAFFEPRVSLPALRYLELAKSHSCALGVLLAIAAPNLSTLALVDITRGFRSEALTAARLRGDGQEFPSVERLVLEGCDLSAEAMEELKYLAPNAK